MTVETTNYEKFQTGNPIVRRLINRFYNQVGESIANLQPTSVLDAGCGEGETLDRLGDRLPKDLTGVDLNPDSVEFTAKRLPGGNFMVADLLELPFESDQFDLVFCLEVLEHLPNPAAGLAELARVASRDIVISVPHEPWFRLGSAARGKYLRTWGNHPEHVNHWNPGSLRGFLSDQVEVVEIRTSTPWIIARCRPRPGGSNG